jgi:carbonic anhydrase
MRTHSKESQASLTPEAALEVLQEGNVRFCANLKANRDLLRQVNDTREGQWPFAAVLSCIDSRTSAELIFDQGLGDIFSIRIAGNFLNDDILGSLEFACEVAGAKLIVVLGHSNCGAIKGACDRVELGHLTGLLEKIQPAVRAVPEPSDPANRNSANSKFVEAVAQENVRQTVEAVTERSEVLRKRVSAHQLAIVGGHYDVSTGEVKFTQGPD